MIGERVLVVAPHPDDETLGCGGTLLKLKNEGNQLHWLIMTSITKGLPYSAQKAKQRYKEIQEIRKIFNFRKIHELRYPTTKLDVVPMGELVKKISKIISDVKPETILIPNRSDIHSDHRITFNAALSCTKQFRFPYLLRVLMYETISETEFAPAFSDQYFVPNVFFDISSFIDDKIKAANVYKGEIGSHPFPRSEENIRSLATFRGATINVPFAESFMIVKEVYR